jgi:multidrug transporter EmrE-like cation transporter
MIWIAPLLGLIGFEVIADIFAKEYSLKGGLLWFGAIMSYVIANSFWLYSLKHGAGLARGATIFSVSTAVLATIIGVYFYHEELKTFQIIGIAFGMVALILIFWKQ